ncbi:MAG: XisI protein [Planctomycetes bacterium]|nr:XisI protein [Planctomycetota bacterium]
MDRMNRYHDLIKRGLTERRDFTNGRGRTDIEAVCVFDDEAGQYLLLWVGWQNKRRVDNTMLHVRLHEHKIWIETDRTEDGFATELIKAGVPNSDIVLAFHPPHLRQYTDFAVA